MSYRLMTVDPKDARLGDVIQFVYSNGRLRITRPLPDREATLLSATRPAQEVPQPPHPGDPIPEGWRRVALSSPDEMKPGDRLIRLRMMSGRTLVERPDVSQDRPTVRLPGYPERFEEVAANTVRTVSPPPDPSWSLLVDSLANVQKIAMELAAQQRRSSAEVYGGHPAYQRQAVSFAAGPGVISGIIVDGKVVPLTAPPRTFNLPAVTPTYTKRKKRKKEKPDA